MTPIGWVRSSRTEPSDDDWDATRPLVELDGTQFTAEALSGLDDFSHVEIVFVFDRVDPSSIVSGARRPRDNPQWPLTGIFAQRASARPNRIGVTVCRIVSLRGLQIGVEGLDAIDGTPVLDIKPYMDEFGPRGRRRQPRWSHELMTRYWSSPGA